MLVVISIMAILATLMFPALRAVKQNQIRTRARGELIQLETAIHAYQDKFGHYPPDSGPPYVVNQLYYELLGTSAAVITSGSESTRPSMDCAKANERLFRRHLLARRLGLYQLHPTRRWR